MNYVFSPAAPVAIPVSQSDSFFPVRRVYCVGQNYAAHAAEMGGDGRQPPFFFSKPADALVPGNGPIKYPTQTNKLQHEVELVVAIGQGGADIQVDQALSHVFGYTVGIDLTRRDLQAAAKNQGRPWDLAKGFDQSGPIGAIVAAEQCGHPSSGRIRLSVNGTVTQDGDLAQMSWNVAEVIANLSTYVQLAAGDLIFTGTPAGVSTVVRGDVLSCAIEGIGTLETTLV